MDQPNKAETLGVWSDSAHLKKSSRWCCLRVFEKHSSRAEFFNPITIDIRGDNSLLWRVVLCNVESLAAAIASTYGDAKSLPNSSSDSKKCLQLL